MDESSLHYTLAVLSFQFLCLSRKALQLLTMQIFGAYSSWRARTSVIQSSLSPPQGPSINDFIVPLPSPPPWNLIDQLNIFAGQLYLRDYDCYIRLCRLLGIPSTGARRNIPRAHCNLSNIHGNPQDNEHAPNCLL